MYLVAIPNSCFSWVYYVTGLREGILAVAGRLGGGGGFWGLFNFPKTYFFQGEKQCISYQITGIYGLLFALRWEHRIPQVNDVQNLKY